jgi:hypothetical protein
MQQPGPHAPSPGVRALREHAHAARDALHLLRADQPEEARKRLAGLPMPARGTFRCDAELRAFTRLRSHIDIAAQVLGPDVAAPRHALTILQSVELLAGVILQGRPDGGSAS